MMTSSVTTTIARHFSTRVYDPPVKMVPFDVIRGVGLHRGTFVHIQAHFSQGSLLRGSPCEDSFRHQPQSSLTGERS